uniref:Na_Ca_ex domain-containing protein n=1 Tax=Macrostomum lignano TaxID=282301 RepID=A0A1I8IHV2_9PLAT
ENRQRQLYRIESVDEALDDDTVDRLNRLNEQRMMEERQREREEREAAAAAQEAAAAERQDAGEDDEVDENQSPIKEFFYSLVPVDLEEFPEMTWYNKVYEIIKAPLLFLLLLSTPFVDYDQPLNGWSRILNSVHCAIAPVFIALAFKGYNWMIPFEGGGGFPIVVIVLIVGIALGILVYFTSSDFEPPKYHAAFAFIGFLTAIVWIYTFANEVVNILESVGSIFRISSTILGLTVLAWANSIGGDVIANTVLARQNFPRVAISACFGGPLFNLLLGVGIPFTIKLLSDGTTEMRIEASVVQLLLVVSVTASLIVSMVYLTVMRFKLGRVYGIILIVLYLAFLVVALLAETGQLPPLIDRN